MAEPVVLREFSSRNEAEFLREVLEASGIAAFIASDDCGAEGPSLQLSQGARLLVAAEDAEDAEAVIAASEEEGDRPPAPAADGEE
jgi:putative signal transducing protein